MRSGGGLGEFSTGSTQASVAASCEQFGNNDATWPSGPSPSRITSNTGRPAKNTRMITSLAARIEQTDKTRPEPAAQLTS